MEANLPPIASSAETVFPDSRKEDRFDSIAQNILDKPMVALIPTFPAFHSTLIESSSDQLSLRASCSHLDLAIAKTPFFKKLGEIPTHFVKQYRSEDGAPDIKKIGTAYLENRDELLDCLLAALKKRFEDVSGKNVWALVIDWFIDELEIARNYPKKDVKEIDNPITHFLLVSFVKFRKMLTSTWEKPLIDLAIKCYSLAPKRIKKLIFQDIDLLLKIVVDKVGGNDKIHKHRKIFSQAIYEIVDQFLLESHHLAYYKDCLSMLINKVHAEDVPREELKKTYMGALWRIADDIEKSDKLKAALLAGIDKVNEI